MVNTVEAQKGDMIVMSDRYRTAYKGPYMGLVLSTRLLPTDGTAAAWATQRVMIMFEDDSVEEMGLSPSLYEILARGTNDS